MYESYWDLAIEETTCIVVDAGSLGWCIGKDGIDSTSQCNRILDCTSEDLFNAFEQEQLDAHFSNFAGGNDPKDTVMHLQRCALEGDPKAGLFLQAVSKQMLTSFCTKENMKSMRKEALFSCSVLDETDSTAVSGLLEWAFPALSLDRAWIIPQECMVMHALGRKTGLVVNLGLDITVLAVYEGFRLPECARRVQNFHILKLANGKIVLQGRCKQLELSQTAFHDTNDDTFLRFVLQRWICETGIAGILGTCLSDAPLDCRFSLASNIIVSGGGAMIFEGTDRVDNLSARLCLQDCLREALVESLPPAIASKACVHVPCSRHELAMVGGLTIANSRCMRRKSCITREEFDSGMFRGLQSFLVPSNRCERNAAFRRRKSWIAGNLSGTILRKPIVDLVLDFIPTLPETHGMKITDDERDVFSASTFAYVAPEELSDWWQEIWAMYMARPISSSILAVPLVGLAK